MPLFQSSVLKKHFTAQDQSQITLAYEAYKRYFFNQQIQENNRNSKEQQFQEGFLRELLVNILGYTINPNQDFILTTELKNIKDAKKTKVKLNLSEESEWMAYFNEQKQKALALQSEINRIDAEIDALVYKLYGLRGGDKDRGKLIKFTTYILYKVFE